MVAASIFLDSNVDFVLLFAPRSIGILSSIVQLANRVYLFLIYNEMNTTKFT